MLLQKGPLVLLAVTSFLTIIQGFWPHAGMFSPVVPVPPKMLNEKCTQGWGGSALIILSSARDHSQALKLAQ